MQCDHTRRAIHEIGPDLYISTLCGQESNLALLISLNRCLLQRTDLALLALLLTDFILGTNLFRRDNLNLGHPVFENTKFSHVDHLLIFTHIELRVQAHSCGIRGGCHKFTWDKTFCCEVKEGVGVASSQVNEPDAWVDLLNDLNLLTWHLKLTYQEFFGRCSVIYRQWEVKTLPRSLFLRHKSRSVVVD